MPIRAYIEQVSKDNHYFRQHIETDFENDPEGWNFIIGRVTGKSWDELSEPEKDVFERKFKEALKEAAIPENWAELVSKMAEDIEEEFYFALDEQDIFEKYNDTHELITWSESDYEDTTIFNTDFSQLAVVKLEVSEGTRYATQDTNSDNPAIHTYIFKKHSLREADAIKKYAAWEYSNQHEVLIEAYRRALSLGNNGFSGWRVPIFYNGDEFTIGSSMSQGTWQPGKNINGDTMDIEVFAIKACESEEPDYSYDKKICMNYGAWTSDVEKSYQDKLKEEPNLTPYEFLSKNRELSNKMYAEYLDITVGDTVIENYEDSFKEAFRKYLESYYCLEEGYLEVES